jgi:hypothetical protein
MITSIRCNRFGQLSTSTQITILYLVLACITPIRAAQPQSDPQQEQYRLGGIAASYYQKISQGSVPQAPHKTTAVGSQTLISSSRAAAILPTNSAAWPPQQVT